MVSISSSRAMAGTRHRALQSARNMKRRDASCCERNVYHISISVKRVSVFKLWMGFDLVPRLKILRKHLSCCGILEKQDTSHVKTQHPPTRFRRQRGTVGTASKKPSPAVRLSAECYGAARAREEPAASGPTLYAPRRPARTQATTSASRNAVNTIRGGTHHAMRTGTDRPH